MTCILRSTLLAFALAAATVATAPAFAQAGKAPAAAPAAGSPSALVLENSRRILTTLESRRAEFQGNPSALRTFLAGEFDQTFDRDYAARLVLGVHGRGASDADVKAFADALADNLMERYGASLLALNARLQVRIRSEQALRNGAIVKVASEYLRQGNAPVPVDFLMRKVGGQWKVFDVMVEGVSFVQTFRTQFDGPLRQKGIRAVAADLKAGRVQAGTTGG